MLEIEVKILEIDREAAIEKLVALGAGKTFDDEIHALYFDSADRGIRNSRGTLRLRKEGTRTVVTFKHDIDDRHARVREEQEVNVSDFAAMRSIIESLGMSVWLEMRKHRISYELSGLHFEFDRYYDEYAYIPEFLEIEGPSVDAVHRYAALLGFAASECKPWDAVELARYYQDLRNTHL